MSVTRSTRKVHRQSVNQDSGGSELEETHILEERLKNLLSENKGSLNKVKSIFADFQGDVPKLRSSVIARALQKVVCSTPMPTEKQRDFFLSETSFNISPINPISEESENDKKDCDDNENEVRENEILLKEAKILLTREPLPIIISDSSSEEENHTQKNKRGAQSKNKHIIEKKFCYTLRQNKNKNKHDSCNQESSIVIPEQEITKSKRVIPLRNAKVSQMITRKDSLTNRKRIDDNSVAIDQFKSPSYNKNEKCSQYLQNSSLLQLRKIGRSPPKSSSQNRTKNDISKIKSTDQSVNKESNYGEVHFNGMFKQNKNQTMLSSQSKNWENSENEEVEPISMKSPVCSRISKNQIEKMEQTKSPPNKKKERSQNDLESEQIKSSHINMKNTEDNLEPNLKSLIDEISERRSQSILKKKSPNRSSNKFQDILNSLKSTSIDCNRSGRNENSSEGSKIDMKTDIDRQSRNSGVMNNESENFNKTGGTLLVDGCINISAKNSSEKCLKVTHPHTESPQINLLMKNVLHKNSLANDISEKNEEKNIKKITPKKLSFHQDKSQGEGGLTKNAFCKRFGRMEKVSHIPLLRGRSKSKEHISHIEINKEMVLPKSPPKRPPRKKDNRNIEQESKINGSLGGDTVCLKGISNSHEFLENNSRDFIKNNVLDQNEQDGDNTLTPVDNSPNKLSKKKVSYVINASREYKSMPVSEGVLTQVVPSVNENISTNINVSNKKRLVEAGTSYSSIDALASDELRKEQLLAKASIGTSPIIFDDEKTLTEVEQSLQQNDRVSENCLVGKIMVKKNELVDVGTSPLENVSKHLGHGGALSDSDKLEKFNQLVTKMSQRFFNSLNTPSSGPKKGANDLPSCSKMNREIQTSLSKLSQSLFKTNFVKCNLTKNISEQQTQTTNSIDRTLKTYRTNRNMNRTAMNGDISDSKNSSTTDQSEIIKELEREKCHNMLFQSLTEDVVAPNFSSSDEEIMHTVSQQNLPWRLDEDIISVPRRSSYKLNFLRSAQEIEMEKKSTTNSYKNSDSSDTDSEIERYFPQKGKRSNQKKSFSVLGYTNKNKVQVYPRFSQAKHKNKSPSRSVVRKPHIEKEKSSSPDSIVSDTSVIEDIQQNREHAPVISRELLTPSTNKAVSENFDNIDKMDTPLTVKMIEHNKNFNKPHKTNECLTDKNKDQIGNLCVIIETLPLNKRGSNISALEQVNGKDGNKSTSKGTGKSKKNSADIQENIDSDHEILAVSLEDSVISPRNEEEEIFIKERTWRKSKSQEFDKAAGNSTQHEQSNEIKSTKKQGRTTVKSSKKQNIISSLNDQSEEPNFKVPKARGRKSKKQNLTENDDAVSSTTSESGDLTGVRRSGRERKPAKRMVWGFLATDSEKILRSCSTCEIPTCEKITNKTSKSTTKKKDKVKKNLNKNETENSNSKKFKSPVKSTAKTKKRGRQKKVESSDLVVIENTETPAVTSKMDDSESGPGVNMEPRFSDRDTSKLTRGKKQSDINGTISSSEEQEVPRKKNKKANKSNDRLETSGKSSKKNTDTDRVSSTSEYHMSSGTDVAVENNHAPDENLINANNVNLSCHENNVTDIPQSTGYQVVQDRNTDDFVCRSRIPQNTTNSEERTRNRETPEKDSGRSTMLKSNTLDDSNLRLSKPLTGRIKKRYKKKDNIGSKISKKLSRSNNCSKELELFIGADTEPKDKEVPSHDERKLRRSSLMQRKPTEGDHIRLLSNNEIISMKYIEKTANYKIVRDNLMVTDSIKNGSGTMGHLKLPPGCQKPLHIARKFNLFYFVIEGEGFIQVHNMTSRVGKLSKFVVPLGVEYSINNVSKEDSLVLGFVKVPPTDVDP